MLKADLHLHSTVSDGSDSIEVIIEKAKKKNLDVIGITDHDTLSQRNQIPENPGIQVIVGIEISGFDTQTQRKAHILGYGIENHEQVESFTRKTLMLRHENCLKQMDILSEMGYSFDESKINKADQQFFYKQHLLEYLVNTQQITTKYGEFYNKTFKNGGPCDIDIQYVEACEAVEIIKNAGGISVLAHPGQQENFDLIPKFVEVGLQGIEYNHIKNTEKHQKIIKQYSEDYHLFLTGGSDYHGTNDSEKIEIGDCLSENCGVIALC
ncbi:MAG: PHP domain-containing protein [Eubacteriaceae bacterium]